MHRLLSSTRAFSPSPARSAAAERLLPTPPVDETVVRKLKGRLAIRLPRIVFNGISVARAQTTSLASNTCCTTLLMQGTAASGSSLSPT